MRWQAVRVARLLVATMLLPQVAFSQSRQARPQGQIPDRGRPTERGDAVPLFDYDAYFPAPGDFDGRLPEMPWGEGGTNEGPEE